MPFVVPDVCRFTVHGTFGSRPFANIIDMQIDTTGSTESREDACFNQCGIIINEWCDHILPKVVNDHTFTRVTWVDLDEPDGSTGERTSTAQETLPQTGASASDPLPPNVSFLLNKRINGGRTRRNGRMYIVGLSEGSTTAAAPDRIDSVTLAGWNTELASFLGNVNQSGGGSFDFDSRLAVVHILSRDDAGHPLTGDYRVVESLNGQALLATQRRRLRG